MFSVPAFAGNTYFGIQVGPTFLSDADTSITGFVPATFSFKTGLGASLALGTTVGNFRYEGELAYRKNNLDKWSDSTGTISLSGDISSLSMMINGYYDIKTSSSFTPYLGVGIGYSRVSADASYGGIKLIDDNDQVLAYQFMAGVGIPINATTTFDLNYRYFATAEPSFKSPAGRNIDTDYSSHNLMVGMRFAF